MSIGSPPLATVWHSCSYNGVVIIHHAVTKRKREFELSCLGTPGPCLALRPESPAPASWACLRRCGGTGSRRTERPPLVRRCGGSRGVSGGGGAQAGAAIRLSRPDVAPAGA